MKMAVSVEKISMAGYSLLVLRDDEKTIFPVVSLTIRTDVCRYIEELIKKDQAERGHEMQELRSRDCW